MKVEKRRKKQTDQGDNSRPQSLLASNLQQLIQTNLVRYNLQLVIIWTSLLRPPFFDPRTGRGEDYRLRMIGNGLSASASAWVSAQTTGGPPLNSSRSRTNNFTDARERKI